MPIDEATWHTSDEPGRPSLTLFRDIFIERPRPEELPAPLRSADALLAWRERERQRVKNGESSSEAFAGLCDPEDRLTPEGRVVRRTGHLTEQHLFLTLLRTSKRMYSSLDHELGWVSLPLLGTSGSRPEKISRQWEHKLQKICQRCEVLVNAEPSRSELQWILYLDGYNRIRLNPLADFAYPLLDEDVHLPTRLAVRVGITQPPTSLSITFTADSVAQLEDLMNSSAATEPDFQKFFECNPEFLLGIDYAHIHPQLILHQDHGPAYRPDFFLEPLSSAFCDVMDIKTPYEELVIRLRETRRKRFRAAVNEYIAQLAEYRRYFDDAQNQLDFHSRYGLKCYQPKVILLIGRKHHFRSDLERQELKALLPRDLELWTYDDILARASAYRRFEETY